ncbi:MAG: (d)CMP kinase [Mycoplasmoidaceae bacterium]|nr:(d)CMP kinase [Mycoplasmoidaceae bacterium]
MKHELVQVAIDGPAGSGKTTVGQLVAQRLGIIYMSTGRIFRSYAFALQDIDCKNEEKVVEEMKQFKFQFKDGTFFINGLDVTLEIMKDVHSMNASTISKYPEVRKRYEKDLKEIIKTTSLVMDGRDIGTVILPDSPYKFYLDAEVEERTRRRAKDNGIKVGSKEFKKLLEDIKARDYQDTHRKVSPLKKARDAMYIDSTKMTKEEVVDLIVDTVNKKRNMFIVKNTP